MDTFTTLFTLYIYNINIFHFNVNFFETGKYVIQKKKHKEANKWYCAENNLTIFRCSMAKSGEYHWFISQAGE